ncbi:hypothetical protein [Maridesulfovibrio frigidus]|uniref:hypothetical protein n=1 Tax=Maridesulfovibrio frigidus TaxID=340956 RepID=UPI000AC7F2EB|nr:hypothetical protein [Maridesulfovibrio frigidus]
MNKNCLYEYQVRAGEEMEIFHAKIAETYPSGYSFEAKWGGQKVRPDKKKGRDPYSP